MSFKIIEPEDVPEDTFMANDLSTGRRVQSVIHSSDQQASAPLSKMQETGVSCSGRSFIVHRVKRKK